MGKRRRFYKFLNCILDVVLIVAAYYVAILLWLLVIRDNPNNIARTMDTAWAVALSGALVSVLVYQLIGLYDALRARSVQMEIVRVLEGTGIAVLVVAALLYIFRLQEFSRGVLICYYGIACVFVIAKRLTARYVLHYVYDLGFNQKKVIVVGDGPLAGQYIDAVRQNRGYGFTVVGYIGREGAFSGVPCLGSDDALAGLIAGPEIDEVVAALGADEVGRLPDIIRTTEKQGTRVCVLPFYNDLIPTCTTMEAVGACKLINVRTIPLDNPLKAGVKRTMDILGASFAILLSSPLMLFAAVGTRLSSPGPVIFRQERVGLNKKLFTMYKFRSMRVNAAQDTAWSKDEDPRKTKFGSFLRKTSIDELPQLFNVLKGDMSLIGPRPEIPHFVEQFRETIPLYMVKHRVRPGITGWAQVNGYRGDTSIEERIKCDIWYIENWSLTLDIRILFRTVFGGMINSEKLGK